MEEIKDEPMDYSKINYKQRSNKMELFTNGNETIFFSDAAIIEQDICTIVSNGKRTTNGVVLVIGMESGQTEIVLEREELEKCLKAVRVDWES